MEQNYEIPVFLINGFLDSGKTTFIQGTIEQGQFDEAEKKLLLVCEEGETEYDESVLKKHKFDKVVLTKEEFNAQKLKELDKQYDPWLVVMEYNGMWENELLSVLEQPFGWTVYQRITLVDAGTFTVYWGNMKTLIADAIRNTEMIIFNRCTAAMNLGSYRRSVKMLNGAAQIVFENVNGELASIAEQLPYDVNSAVIEVDDADYGIWYMDVSERPEVYKGKKVRFKGQVYRGKKSSDKSFVPGRKAMTCCAADTAFIGYICNYSNCGGLAERSWVTVEAVIKYEFAMAYKKKGPVLYASSIKEAEPPAEELVYF